MFANRLSYRAAVVAAFVVVAGVLAWSCGANPTHAQQPPAAVPALRLDAATLWVVAPDEPEPCTALARRGERLVQGLRPAAECRGEAAREMVGADCVFRHQCPLAQAVQSATLRRGRVFLLAFGATGRRAGAGRDRRRPRGAIYAAYAVSEELLGVDPWYFWVDHEPAPEYHVAIPAAYASQWGPPCFKYRGWFINDEDLLGRFAPAPLRDGVFSLEMWDRIYETLLRLRANTVIPGTFTFPDERMQVLAAKRGLVNSQHHICVVGLNTFQWPNEFPYSYRTYPGILDEAWQLCVDALKDREAVWTVGFRGRHDRAFWADDPEVKTPEARGKLISDAIARQVEMVRRAQPHADCIANLWVEGVDLYKAGHLKLPPGVIRVWPDDGAGLIRDQVEARAGDGIYYHTAMLSGRHSQLTEIVPPGGSIRRWPALSRRGPPPTLW